MTNEKSYDDALRDGEDVPCMVCGLRVSACPVACLGHNSRGPVVSKARAGKCKALGCAKRSRHTTGWCDWHARHWDEQDPTDV